MAYPQETFASTTFTDPSFILRRRNVVFDSTLFYQLKVLKDTGRYDAFKLQWMPAYDIPEEVWPVPNHLFWDSDIAKWIEGACYFMMQQPNEEIDAAVKELVDMIRGAQQEDGYLNIHFMVVEPGKRFTNLKDMHELYNLGHLIEAALAHNLFYGNDLLMEPICKYVDLLCELFGPGEHQSHGYPGHPEIELALLRLSQRTKNEKYFNLCTYFLEERGNPTGQDGEHFYDVEARKRGENPHMLPDSYPAARSYWYHQAHRPIVEQESIMGHSVRAMYLLTAVADLVRLKGTQNAALEEQALKRLWHSMVDKKMSLTGGIGAEKKWEGFGIDYFLPQGTDDGGCYNETCAAIGVMMLAERLLQIDLDGKYADIMELCFLNATMTGMSKCGTRFTYANQLASSDANPSQRKEWFTCACCPPNVTRLIGYIGAYLWSYVVNEDKKSLAVNVHMYSSAKLQVSLASEVVELTQSSNWPWDGKINFEVSAPAGISTSLRLRIPGWADEWQLTPASPNLRLEKGYLEVSSDYISQHPRFQLNIPMKVRTISPHPYTNQDVVALARGPIIYCLEDSDNAWVQDHFKSLVFDPQARIEEILVTDSPIGEPYVALKAENGAHFLDFNVTLGPELSAKGLSYAQRDDVKELHFVPYGLRDNRGGRGHMRVGLRRKH